MKGKNKFEYETEHCYLLDMANKPEFKKDVDQTFGSSKQVINYQQNIHEAPPL